MLLKQAVERAGRLIEKIDADRCSLAAHASGRADDPSVAEGLSLLEAASAAAERVCDEAALSLARLCARYPD